MDIKKEENMTLKELIYKVRGDNRNMTKLAKAIGISPSKLYRIANGDLSRPISEADLIKIANDKNAKKEGVTLQKLKTAASLNKNIKRSEFIYNTPDEVAKLERIAQQSILDFLSRSGYSPHFREYTKGSNFDFSIDITIKNTVKHLFFDVKSSYYYDVVDRKGIYADIGRIICSDYDDSNWYYIVIVDTMTPSHPDFEEEDRENAIMFNNISRFIHPEANISLLSIYARDYEYDLVEICLRPEYQFINLGNTSLKERHNKFLKDSDKESKTQVRNKYKEYSISALEELSMVAEEKMDYKSD